MIKFKLEVMSLHHSMETFDPGGVSMNMTTFSSSTAWQSLRRQESDGTPKH
jgi:hypothetical protein